MKRKLSKKVVSKEDGPLSLACLHEQMKGMLAEKVSQKRGGL